jgi:putative iron-dependent peroxidase
LLDFSRAVTGNLFFVPSATFLEDVTDGPTDVPTAAAPQIPQPNPPPHDGSLGIGSLKGHLE